MGSGNHSFALRWISLLILFAGMIGCSKHTPPDLAGEFTLHLTNRLRLEKTDGENIFLVDSRGHKAIEGKVNGIWCEDNIVVLHIRGDGKNQSNQFARISLLDDDLRLLDAMALPVTYSGVSSLHDFLRNNNAIRMESDVYRLR